MLDDPVQRLNAALEGRYRVDHQLGEGGYRVRELHVILNFRQELGKGGGG